MRARGDGWRVTAAAAAIITTVPAINFSGYLYPAAALEDSGRYIGMGFPSLWFQNVSLGTFAMNVRTPKGTRLDDKGKWIVALRRENGMWRIVGHCFNTDLSITELASM